MSTQRVIPVTSPLQLIWTAIGVFAVAVAVLGGLALNLFSGTAVSILQVGLLVAGFIALVLTVAGVTLTLSSHGLSKHEHAFALPQGTIRACLALGLLVAFVSLAVFLYAGTAHENVNLVHNELQSEPKDLPDGLHAVQHKDGYWQVFSVNAAEAQRDLSKQIFTTLATALATVVGFYFGSRAANTQGGEAPDTEKTPAEGAQEAAESAKAAAERTKANVARIDQAVAKLTAAKKVDGISALKAAAIEKELEDLAKRKALAEKEVAKAVGAAKASLNEATAATSEKDTDKQKAHAKAAKEANKKAQAALAATDGYAKAATEAVKRLVA